MVVQCCVCQRIRQDGEWTAESHVEVMHDEVSHGYCPVCAEQAYEEIRALHRTPAFRSKEVANF